MSIPLVRAEWEITEGPTMVLLPQVGPLHARGQSAWTGRRSNAPQFYGELSTNADELKGFCQGKIADFKVRVT